MWRTAVPASLALCVALLAAPVPPRPDAKALVAGLCDPSEKVRDQSTRELRGRRDALPWLRRTARANDKDAVHRANDLLALFEKPRQQAAPNVIDACIRNKQADLFTEWHQFWQPETTDALWPVGPRMGKAAVDEYAKRFPEEKTNHLEDAIARMCATGLKSRYHDGPMPSQLESDLWHLRTNRLRVDFGDLILFASASECADLDYVSKGYYFVLGPIVSQKMWSVVAAGDGLHGTPTSLRPGRINMALSFVVCRGDTTIPGSDIFGSVLLVEGDIDLTGSSRLEKSTIRASGRIHLSPNCKPQNCVIEEHAKDATAPYKFFELADVGLLVADDEEGLVVREAKPNTPFGNCGLAKGDLIRAIDDAPAGHSEQFRKAVRRALVRQGDCLLTVTRGDKTIDLLVFFPLPK